MGLEDRFQYFTWTQTILLIGGILIVVGLFSWNFFINVNHLESQIEISNNILNNLENIIKER